MLEIVILHDDDCPGVAATRDVVARALHVAQMHASVRLVQRGSEPPHLQGFASPTVLVDGLDVAGGESCAGPACRLYMAGDRLSGAPSLEQVLDALRQAASR